MAYDLGGMLARSGATAGQLMGGGIADVGAGIGGMLTRRRERQAEEEKKRAEKGIFGGTRAVQQAANAGQLTPEMLEGYIGSMEGLGVPYAKLLENINNLKTTQEVQASQNALIKDFNQWATTNNISPEIAKDVERGIKGKQITTVQGAIDLATENEQKAFQKDYFADLSTYDSAIGVLVSRGAFEAAETRFQKLQAEQKERPSREFLADFQNKGGEITNENRGNVWNAVVGTSADINEATTIMKRLEAQSIEKRAAKHKGPTTKITYIPKAQTQAEGQISYSLGDSSRVPTKQIEAPIDPKTGKVDAQWMADFQKHSAERIIGMGENAPEPTDTNTPPPQDSEPQGQTPMDLARNMGYTVE